MEDLIQLKPIAHQDIYVGIMSPREFDLYMSAYIEPTIEELHTNIKVFESTTSLTNLTK